MCFMLSIPTLVDISLEREAPPAIAVIMELYVAGSRNSCFRRFSVSSKRYADLSKRFSSKAESAIYFSNESEY